MVVVAGEGEGEGLPCEWQTHQFGYFVKFTSCKLSSRKHPQKRTSFTALVCFTDLIENLFFYPNIVESVPSLWKGCSSGSHCGRGVCDLSGVSLLSNCCSNSSCQFFSFPPCWYPLAPNPKGQKRKKKGKKIIECCVLGFFWIILIIILKMFYWCCLF